MDSLQYIDRSTYIVLYRMFAGGTVAQVPDMVDGKPVRELADHVFSDEPSVMYPQWQIQSAVLADGSWVRTDKADLSSPLSGKILTEVYLPDTLTAIGNYAFYGCEKLRAVTFPSKIYRIGSGIFNFCPSLRRLYFRTRETTPPVLQEILQTVSHQVETVTLAEDGTEKYRLVFPEFYEEPRENTPARLIQIIWHGTGYQYRQCFLERQLQFAQYDEILPLTIAQEAPVTTVWLCLDRLKYPVRLSDQHKKAYVSCLQRMSDVLWDFMKDDQETGLTEWLQVLESADFYTSSSIDSMIDAAASSHRADAAVFLMDLKHRKFAPDRCGKGKYEF